MRGHTTVVSIPVNLPNGWGSRETEPSFAGVVYATVAVIEAMASAVLIDGAVIKLHVLVAFMLMILSAGYGIVAPRRTIP